MTRPAHHSAGFTLVEMLVALVLAALVVSGLSVLTAQWLPNWKRGIERMENAERVALALRRISADIGAATFVPATTERPRPLFAGRPSAVTFVRTALGPNARPGLEIVRLAAEGGGLARSTAPYVPRAAGDAAPRFGAPVQLLRAPYQIDFSYSGEDGLWRGSWSDVDQLPRAVRIVVRDGRTGRPLNVSTVAELHVEAPASCLSSAMLPICNGSGTSDFGPAPPAEGQAP